MRLVIGVMGTADAPIPDEAREKALRLGRAVARSGCILITGGCPGLPYAAVQGARAEGGLVERLIVYYRGQHYKRPNCFCPAEDEQDAEARAG